MTRAKQRSGPSFTGLLNEPIDIDPWMSIFYSLFRPEDAAKRRLSRHLRILGARLEKLPLLAKHYSIDEGPDGFLWLALRLATDFVPGFRDKYLSPTPGPGGPKGLDQRDLLTFVAMFKTKGMVALTANTKRRGAIATTDIEACKIIAAARESGLEASSPKSRPGKTGSHVCHSCFGGPPPASREIAHLYP